MKNPWLDFASYQYSDSYRFKGRDKDIAKFKLIMDNGTMSVLYAESGIGKTSFINAGIEPEFVKKGYFPIHILFNEDTFNSNIDVERWLISDIESKFYEVIKGSDSEEEYKRKVIEWHYLYADTCSEIDILCNNLWWRLHAYKIRNLETGEILKPLIVFDQFEEVFVKGREGFLNSLFSIIEQVSSTTLPDSVSCALDEIEEFEYLEIDRQHFFKILFSLRKDFLSDFDYWSNDRYSITELFQNRMLLKALSREQARQVICDQDGIDTLDEVADDIIEKIDDKHHDAVEPFILSVFCSRLFEKAVGLNKEILKKEDLVQIDVKNIIRSFYEDKILSLIPNEGHRLAFETTLVDEDGFRKRERIASRKLAKIGFERTYAKPLEDAHLIRIITINDAKCVEIVHDRIAEVISERNKQRESEKQAAREKAEAERRQRELEEEVTIRKEESQKRQRFVIVFSIISLLLLVTTSVATIKWNEAEEAKRDAESAKTRAEEQTAIAEEQTAIAKEQTAIAKAAKNAANKETAKAKMAKIKEENAKTEAQEKNAKMLSQGIEMTNLKAENDSLRTENKRLIKTESNTSSGDITENEDAMKKLPNQLTRLKDLSSDEEKKKIDEVIKLIEKIQNL